MAPTEKKDVPAEARLIRRARQALGLSPERIVERLTRVKMSGRNWRQIEDGRAAPDETIAHMAHAVGITPARLAETGRTEAAEILRAIAEQIAAEHAQIAESLDPTDAELAEMIKDARGDRVLYEALLSVWRLRHPRTGDLTKSDPANGSTSDTA